MNTKQVFELLTNEQQTLLNCLKQTNLSVLQLKQLAQQGSIWYATRDQKPRRVRRLKKMVPKGTEIWLYYNPELLNQIIRPAKLITDQEDYSVWFKPRGMFSQPTKWSDANSIGRFVEVKLNRPTYLVHRLDRMTAGLILLSHKRSLVQVFTDAFTHGQVDKRYFAVISGQLKQQRMTIKQPIDNKPAHTDLEELNYQTSDNLSLLQATIHSGKKHQIRRHLASLNHPIIGDRLYGDQSTTEELQLVAVELGFSCPVKHEKIKVRLSDDLLKDLLLLEYDQDVN